MSVRAKQLLVSSLAFLVGMNGVLIQKLGRKDACQESVTYLAQGCVFALN
jgi:hypothetical protein